MNKILVTLMLAGFAAMSSASTAFAATPQMNQQKRIAQGVRSGELTRPEARHLERNARRIHRSIRRDRLDQGQFTPRERAKAQRKLNRQSRAIYRQKHDRQDRD